MGANATGTTTVWNSNIGNAPGLYSNSMPIQAGAGGYSVPPGKKYMGTKKLTLNVTRGLMAF